MFRPKTSIAFLVAVAVAGMATLVLGAIALFSYRSEEQRGIAQLRIDQAIVADQMALSLALPVWNLDRAQIDKIIEGNMQDRDNFAIVVLLADINKTVHARTRDGAWNVRAISQEPPRDQDLFMEKRSIIANDNPLGTVTIFVTPRFLEADLKKTLTNTIFEIAILDALLILSLYLLLWRVILKPLKILERDATRAGIGKAKTMGLQRARFRGELESLRASLETMFRLLNSRYEELQESEERYRNLNAAAFEGIGISENGRVVDANDQMLEMFGYERSEILGKEVADLIAPESRAAVAEAIREGHEAIYEHRLLRKDGSSFFAEARATVIRSGGRTLRMTALRDITERKLSEELNKTQSQVLEMITRGEPLSKTLDALLRMIEAQSPEMLCSILLLDPDGAHVRHGAAPSLPVEYMKAIDGLAIGPSTGSCGTAAFRREQVFVKDIAEDPLWKDYKHMALAHGLRACWSTPIFDAQRKVLGTFAIYYRSCGLPNDRHLRLIETATHTAAVCITKNNSDQALHESEERFRALVEFSPDCIAVAVNEKLVYMNPAGAKLIGADSVSEIIGRDVYNFVPEELHELMRERRKHVLEHNVSSPVVEFPLLRLDGSTVVIESKAVPFIYGGQPGILNLMRDVTERKNVEIERAQVAAREKTAREEFTHLLISSQEAERQRIAAELHDSLGQNLSIIKNRVLLASQQSGVPSSAGAHLHAIERIVSEAISETRTMAHNLRPLHIAQIGLTGSLEGLIRDVSQSCQTHFERRVENVDDVLKGDAATNVYRIVQEALNNLIKYSGAQQAVITVERDIHFVRLRVSDNGVGFNPEHARSHGGLGLTTMTERVRMLGGRLNIQSTPGHGTELMVELPIAELDGDALNKP